VSEPEILVDTSVAVAILVSDHEHHRAALHAVADRRAGLCGHAAFETFSVLTRLPSPARRSSTDVAELIRANFPGTRFLSVQGAGSLLERLPLLGADGGSVHDMLVGATAAEHRLPLLTRDRRALPAYRALGVALEVLA
jgi:predicted nucleic acid-binding protein